jgi:3-hydroxyisobutyrate dehydrogenase
MTRVGWIGLGAMGAPMAACVARAGHETIAFDVDAERVRELDGVEAAATAAAAATGVDVLALMVATAEQVDSVLDGIAGALQPPTTVMVMATVGPAAVQEWARRLSVEIVDAPVSGGVARAGEGDLLIMVGGSEPAVERVRPLLDALARSAPVVGPEPGDGQKVKLVNQLLCGVHIAAAAEGLAFAEAMGLEARACWEVIRDGAAASFMLDDRGERMVDGAFEEAKSSLDIFVKDMGLVTGAAAEHAYPAPLAAAAEQLYLAGRRAGLGRLDDSSLITVMRGE